MSGRTHILLLGLALSVGILLGQTLATTMMSQQIAALEDSARALATLHWRGESAGQAYRDGFWQGARVRIHFVYPDIQSALDGVPKGLPGLIVLHPGSYSLTRPIRIGIGVKYGLELANLIVSGTGAGAAIEISR